MSETTNSTPCLRCGRTLTSAKSIGDGMGRTCKAKVAAAAQTTTPDYKPAQVDKAMELIEQGGIVPFRGRRIFRTVSSDGTRTYLTAPQACNCAAGLRGRHICFHRIAASIIAAA